MSILYLRRFLRSIGSEANSCATTHKPRSADNRVGRATLLVVIAKPTLRDSESTVVRSWTSKRCGLKIFMPHKWHDAGHQSERSVGLEDIWIVYYITSEPNGSAQYHKYFEGQFIWTSSDIVTPFAKRENRARYSHTSCQKISGALGS